MTDRSVSIDKIWPFRRHISIADVMAKYPPQECLADWEPEHKKYNGPVYAFARAVYETQPQEATDYLLRMMGYFHRKISPSNLWQLPTYERLPYPYAVYWPLGCAFLKEKKDQRRFDWLVWMDDDVLASPMDLEALIAAADPDERPFVSALPYDRFEPHCPAVTEMVDGQLRKWVKAPASGTHKCFHVGLCLAVFHRSLFERVPEPWFAAMPPIEGFAGIAPDWWWSYQMHKVNIDPYVCCDANVIHLGRKLHVNREYSEQWQKRSPRRNHFPTMLDNDYKEAESGALTAECRPHPDGRWKFGEDDK